MLVNTNCCVSDCVHNRRKFHRENLIQGYTYIIHIAYLLTYICGSENIIQKSIYFLRLVLIIFYTAFLACNNSTRVSDIILYCFLYCIFFSSGKRASILTGDRQLYIVQIQCYILLEALVILIIIKIGINNNNMGLLFFFFYFCTPQIDAASIDFPAAQILYAIYYFCFYFNISQEVAHISYIVR